MKLKRFLTGVLSAVMALSVCALPALADDETTVKDPTNPKLTASTIDKTQVGSITIHKYGQLEEDSSANDGTGEADATVATNPENKPLEGVEFTLYRVKTTADLLKYYDALEGASVEEFTAGDCFTATNESEWSATTLKPTYTTSATGNGADAPVGKVGTAKTNAKGAAQFNGLPVGMYLVIETNKVQSVTKTVTPFLVSIPMTRIGDTKSETTGDNNLKQWLYDVVVYPKNSTAQGTVTLVKQGKHGDATPEKLGGVMFKLFQYQGADGSGKYVDITDKLTNKTTDGYVVTDSDTNLGKITFSDLPMGKYYVQEYGYTGKGSDKGYIINTNGKYGFKIDDQGKVAVQAETGTDETGWVTENDGFSAGNGTITITNYKPEFEKTVEPRTGTTSTDNHQADYGIGDKVPYTLTIKVPENVAKLHTFKVVDTTLKDQLLHIDNDFTLTATDKNNGTPTLENDAYTKEITVGKDAEKKDTSILTVNFTPAKLASVAGGTITIRYYATLGAGAVVADNGNLNTAKLLYSRKTDTDGSSETDKKPYEITDEGVVYTFMTRIEKKGKGGSYDGIPMPGVTFALYRKVEDAEWNNGDKVTIAGQEYTKKGAVPGATAVELGLAATENETWVLICHDAKGRELEATTDKNGTVEYKGLPSGTYKFIETKTLDKYNLLTSPVDAKLSLSYTTTWKDISAYDENGNLTNHKSGTVKYENGDPKAVIQIVNRSGFQLPVTGGFGTLLFSGIGVLLVLAGVAVLFSMKKKNDRA